MLKRAWTGHVFMLLRIQGHNQEKWTPHGWEPSANLEWTGIGGSVDWDSVSEEEARAAIEELGGDPDDIHRA